MKKLIFGLLAVTAFSFTMFAQAGSNIEQRAKNKAEAAARECIGDLGLQNGLQLTSFATLNLYCDNFFHPNPNWGGFYVQVYAQPNCPPNQACIQVIYHVADVWVDCQGNAYQVECASPIILAP